METPAANPSVAVQFNGQPDVGNGIYWLERALEYGLRADVCERVACHRRNLGTSRFQALFSGAFELNKQAQRKWDEFCGRGHLYV